LLHPLVSFSQAHLAPLSGVVTVKVCPMSLLFSNVAPSALRERGLKTQSFAFHPFSVRTKFNREKGAGDEG
jgi:hypothetical protein